MLAAGVKTTQGGCWDVLVMKVVEAGDSDGLARKMEGGDCQDVA